MKIFGWVRDPHHQPHVNREGGCACRHECCVRLVGTQLKCTCPRCNEECTAIGRLGSPDLTSRETMPPWGQPVRASRWYRR